MRQLRSVELIDADEALVAQHRADEAVLSDHMEEFFRVGLALARIREPRSYRRVDGFERFEDYCRQKWDVSKTHANRLVAASEIRQVLPDLPGAPGERHPLGATEEAAPLLAWTERHMRDFLRLRSEGKARRVAERIVAVVRRCRRAGEKVKLGAIVRREVDRELKVKRGKAAAQEAPAFAEVMHRWCGRLDAMADVVGGLSDDQVRLFSKDEPLVIERFAKALTRVSAALERFQAARAEAEQPKRVMR